VKYPSKLCTDDHLTHMFPQLVEPHNHVNVHGSPAPTSNNPDVNIYMMKSNANLSTKTYDYGMPESVDKGKEASNPLTPLQIEKTVGKAMNHIPKGAFKKASHNPNARVVQNYLFMEDLA